MSSGHDLTTADLVVLSLLAERPRHGYDLVAELERRDVRDWAAISRAQVYYSLRKLEAAGLLLPGAGTDRAAGPERRVFDLAPGALKAIRDSLARPEWATQRPPPPFGTWLALSWLAERDRALKVVRARRAFLAAEAERERATLEEIHRELGAGPSVPALMVDQAIRQFELELEWLGAVEKVVSERSQNIPH